DLRVARTDRELRVVRAHLIGRVLPVSGVMARAARFGPELAVVDVLMAGLARRELDRLPLRRRAEVTLFARDVGVLAGERVARQLVVERLLVERLEVIDERVTLLALDGELAVVDVLVAADARGLGVDELRL